jgi:pimeloyl-ACP methyl ester carboxylesterase
MASVEANGLLFEVELAGPADAPVVLLVMGLGMQKTAWPATLLAALQKGGFRTLIFDQRDTGLSSKIDAAGRPNIIWASIKQRLGMTVRAPYRIADMAADAMAIAKALGIERYHLVGASMGGMIGQHLAASAPPGLLSLCLIMSTSGAPGLPSARRDVMRVMMQKMPDNANEDALVARYVNIFKVIGSPDFPTPAAVLEARARISVRRNSSSDGTLRHMLSILVDGDRSALLENIKVATLVVHGVADPLLPLACGEDLARKIAHARLLTIPGMGHDFPDALMPMLAENLIEHFNAAA